MNVKKIRLVNFRNFLDTSLDFDDSINIFIGNNAQGKTNILESIFTLMRGSSYRTIDDQDLIFWNKEMGYLLGEVHQNEEIFHVHILLQNRKNSFSQSNFQKKFIQVNKKLQKKSWLLEKFHPVVFTPEDLQIIKSTPSIRRRFLDEVVVNLYPVYYQYLRDYHHILFQRNTLLRKEKNQNEIDRQLSIWDNKIIDLGALIILYRVKVLQKLNQKAKIFHQLITENRETLKLKYHSTILTSYKDEKEEISKIMEFKIKNSREKDFKLKTTTVGPHRDDYFVMDNEVDLGTFGSQGQQRTAVLSLKLAELELFKEKDNEYPPLLLDDVMSELDMERKSFLVRLIKERKMQTFITSIGLDDLTQGCIGNQAKVFQIKMGRVES